MAHRKFANTPRIHQALPDLPISMNMANPSAGPIQLAR